VERTTYSVGRWSRHKDPNLGVDDDNDEEQKEGMGYEHLDKLYKIM
jgi:hypothetical protein